MADFQNYKNHTRLVPAFHFGVFIPLMANVMWCGYQLSQGVTSNGIVNMVMAVVFITMAGSLRVQILTVQDRVIRMEMRQRLAQLLPADLQTQIGSLGPKQLVALRFASDAELPGLVREVLGGTLPTPKDIKLKIGNWQGDFLRA